MTEQAAVVLLSSAYQPLYVSTEAVRILLRPKEPIDMAGSTEAVAGAIRDLIDRGSGSAQAEGGRYGFLEAGGGSYVWTITRCDEWTAKNTVWNYVLMIRGAEPPADKIKAITQQFSLSPRQEQTLAYLFRGLTSKEIANFLDLSPHTVKIHIRALMTKLQVTTRTALVGRVLSAAEPSSARPGSPPMG